MAKLYWGRDTSYVFRAFLERFGSSGEKEDRKAEGHLRAAVAETGRVACVRKALIYDEDGGYATFVVLCQLWRDGASNYKGVHISILCFYGSRA